MVVSALPATLILEVDYILGPARRTLNAFGPAHFSKTIYGNIHIGEVNDRLLEGLGKSNGVHVSIVPKNRRLVKYVLAPITTTFTSTYTESLAARML